MSVSIKFVWNKINPSDESELNELVSLGEQHVPTKGDVIELVYDDVLVEGTVRSVNWKYTNEFTHVTVYIDRL